MKRMNSKFLGILPLLALVGCGNPIENTKQEISNFLNTESKAAEDKCLLEYTEDECIPLYFTIDYNPDKDKLSIELFKPSQSKVDIFGTGTYSDNLELSQAIADLTRKKLGDDTPFIIFWFDPDAKPQEEIID